MRVCAYIILCGAHENAMNSINITIHECVIVLCVFTFLVGLHFHAGTVFVFMCTQVVFFYVHCACKLGEIWWVFTFWWDQIVISLLFVVCLNVVFVLDRVLNFDCKWCVLAAYSSLIIAFALCELDRYVFFLTRTVSFNKTFIAVHVVAVVVFRFIHIFVFLIFISINCLFSFMIHEHMSHILILRCIHQKFFFLQIHVLRRFFFFLFLHSIMATFSRFS